MIRQLVAATTDPARVHPGLIEHQAAMIARCPYLGPSVQRGLTQWSAYEAGPEDEHALLGLLTDYAEQLRRARRTDGPLACRNIAIIDPPDTAAAKALMDWPAWLARNLYAPVQIMVDRFWIGVGRKPGTARSVMPPLAVSFFMVRSNIPHRDRLILSEQDPEALAALAAGPGDDGRDVLTASLGRSVTDPALVWSDLVEAFPILAELVTRKHS
jgi:hypothetical protein